jgi:cytochrome c553
MENVAVRSQFQLSLGRGFAVALAGLLAACEPSTAPVDPLARGKVVYANCVSCHMEDGSGNAAIGAPAISGLPQWYLTAQLHKFRTAQRGSHFEDLTGMKMRPMSLSIRSEADVDAVSMYVAQLPVARKGPTLQGDATKGQIAYATCSACHGLDGAGNEALRAPPLAKLDDWYVVAQLQKFKGGIRGANPADASGATMRPMAATLADEQAMRDVAAHIQGLGR